MFCETVPRGGNSRGESPKQLKTATHTASQMQTNTSTTSTALMNLAGCNKQGGRHAFTPDHPNNIAGVGAFGSRSSVTIERKNWVRKLHHWEKACVLVRIRKMVPWGKSSRGRNFHFSCQDVAPPTGVKPRFKSFLPNLEGGEGKMYPGGKAKWIRFVARMITTWSKTTHLPQTNL